MRAPQNVGPNLRYNYLTHRLYIGKKLGGNNEILQILKDKKEKRENILLSMQSFESCHHILLTGNKMPIWLDPD